MAPLTDKTGNYPLVVIVGQTASGKSDLAIKVAERFNGEIIAADSRTVYKGMDIGTAKPSQYDQQIIKHHLLDVIEPNQSFTVVNFQKLALKAIDGISSRGKLPIVVGGTGLYVDSILFCFNFRSKSDSQKREELQKMTIDQLQSMFKDQNIALPNNPQNPRHLVRALETGGEVAGKKEIRSNTLVLGLQVDKEVLEKRIRQRVQKMLKAGLEQEVRSLVKKYGWESAVMQSIGYQEFRPYFEGDVSLPEVEQAIVRNSIQYAKRQKTWFRRNKSIHWISSLEGADEFLTTFLDK